MAISKKKQIIHVCLYKEQVKQLDDYVKALNEHTKGPAFTKSDVISILINQHFLQLAKVEKAAEESRNKKIKRQRPNDKFKKEVTK